MKKILTIAFTLILMLVFSTCKDPGSYAGSNPQTGTITGKALYTNSSDNSGIIITLEGTDGLRSVSVFEANRSIAVGNSTDGARSIGARSITGQTTTAADGSFTLTDIPAGAYTLYASSKNSLEKAVTTSVNVQADQVSDAGTLTLTPVGTISGKIVVDDGESDMFGFLVSVAGTSFMAVSGFNGEYEISGVPAGDNYFIIVMKGNFTGIYKDDDGKSKSISVSGGEDTTLDKIVVTTEELNIETRITIGDNGNWFIDGKDTGVKAQGEKGVDGKDGADGRDGKDGTVITISEDGYWVIDGENTNVKAQGKDGTVITISEDGYWVIDGENTNVKAQGKDGTVITISENGYWVIDGEKTNVKAQGKDGTVITISENGYWVIDGIKTDVRAGESDKAIKAGKADELAGKLLIWQAYGSSNNANGASHSFVELYNNTETAIDLSGITLYYADGTRSTTVTTDNPWKNLSLTGTIPAKTSFLILGSRENTTGRLQITDNYGDINDPTFTLSNRAFKAALIRSDGILTAQNPFTMDGSGIAAGYIDMVGSANDYKIEDMIFGFETQPARNSASVAVRRNSLVDTNNNKEDFAEIDYRAWSASNPDRTTDEQLEIYRPKNVSYGAWNPITGMKYIQGDPNITAQAITSFTFLKENIGWEEDLSGEIDQSAKTITFTTQRWIDNIDNLTAVFELDVNGVAYVNGNLQWSGVTQNDFRRDVIYRLSDDVSYTVKFVSPQATGLPVIRIDTLNATPILNRTDWVSMTFSMSDPNNPANDITTISNQQIRGRGNTTWSYPKKPYRIRFANNQQQSPFGLPRSRNWVLLADYLDPTLLKTSVAFELGQRLGLQYTCSYNHVQFYLNGVYQGTYTFTEHRQADPAGLGAPGRPKVDLNEGWFVDISFQFDEEPRFRTTNYNLPIMIKSPEFEPANMTNPAYDFVRNDWNELTDLMACTSFPENGYRDLIDMESIAKFIMVPTIVANFADFDRHSPNEASPGQGSVFFHKDKGGKITGGPLWDFDRSFGFLSASVPQYQINVANRTSRAYLTNPFWARFFQDPLFRVTYKEIWNNNFSDISSMSQFIDGMVSKIKEGAEENFKIWWTNNPVDFDYWIGEMKSFYEIRIAFLNNEYNKVDVLPASRNFTTTTAQTITLVAFGVMTNLSATLQKGNDSPFEVATELSQAPTGNGGYLATISIKPKESLPVGTHTDALVLGVTNQGNASSHNVPLTFSH